MTWQILNYNRFTVIVKAAGVETRLFHFGFLFPRMLAWRIGVREKRLKRLLSRMGVVTP